MIDLSKFQEQTDLKYPFWDVVCDAIYNNGILEAYDHRFVLVLGLNTVLKITELDDTFPNPKSYGLLTEFLNKLEEQNET